MKGYFIMGVEMVLGFIRSIMEINIREIGWIMLKMGKGVISIMRKRNFMKVVLSKMQGMVKVSIILNLAIFLKENGKMM